MGKFSLANLFGITLRESADDGSDFTNPDADYRRVFLGEDGTLKTKNSAGTVATITGGGILNTIVDAKGDIIAATAADTVARLPVGTDGDVLTAASGETTGLEWTTPSGAGLGAWTSYTPTVTGSITNPVIASRLGYYKELDSTTLAVMVNLNFVTGDTAGSGNWSVSLPGGYTAEGGFDQILAGRIHDSGTRYFVVTGFVVDGGTTIGFVHTESGSNGQVTNTAPMTWANGDQLWASGIIQTT